MHIAVLIDSFVQGVYNHVCVLSVCRPSRSYRRLQCLAINTDTVPRWPTPILQALQYNVPLIIPHSPISVVSKILQNQLLLSNHIKQQGVY